LFVKGFYLDPATPSQSIDAGDNAMPFGLTTAPYTTHPNGSTDATPLDIGFHHRTASAGSFDSVLDEPPVQCGEHIIRPVFANRSQGDPGHLISVHPLGAVSIGSRTTINPAGPGDRVAFDRGDGTYAFTAGGAGASVDF